MRSIHFNLISPAYFNRATSIPNPAYLQFLDGLSLKAITHRLDRRRLQEELDLHRTGTGVGPEVAEVLDAEARKLGPAGLKAAVESHLRSQVLSLCLALQDALREAGDPSVAAGRLAAAEEVQQLQKGGTARWGQPGRGLLGGVAGDGSCDPAPLRRGGADSAAASTDGGLGSLSLSRNAVAEAFLRKSGLALRVGPSSVPHSEAGYGLWLRGGAGLGQVVGFYPGVAYSPLHLRSIPGFPLVARDNPFLLSRFDSTVFDAKPWGRGQDSLAGPWPAAPLSPTEESLAALEGRHPLALAHYANHPPPGKRPNVVVAPFDFPTSQNIKDSFGGKDRDKDNDKAGLRAMVPVVPYPGPPGSAGESSVPGVALVACEEIADGEEVLLNYRLNPSSPSLPEWYEPVDAEEDARRWS